MSKEQLRIGTIGHVDHGKTSLTAAISATLTFFNPELDGVFNKKEESRIEYETQTRHYAHVDYPGHDDLVKNMLTGAAQMDGAILVVSAADGIMPQAREHIMLARQVGVRHIVVFLNKMDQVIGDKYSKILEILHDARAEVSFLCEIPDAHFADQEDRKRLVEASKRVVSLKDRLDELQDEAPIDLVENEVRELLSKYEFPGKDLPVIRGSAKAALDYLEANAGSCDPDNLLSPITKSVVLRNRFHYWDNHWVDKILELIYYIDIYLHLF